jgi:hypothetical protein
MVFISAEDGASRGLATLKSGRCFRLSGGANCFKTRIEKPWLQFIRLEME